MTDVDALAEFAKTRSAEAFAFLVRQYIDLVYSTARRISRDSHLAEDVTQAVFIVLARRAAAINPKYLAGWLVNTARLASRDALRARHRKQKHESQAAQMRSEVHSVDEPTVDQISPLLDDALARLNEADRSSVVMRFLQGRTFAEVGKTFGISEEAARKRVTRSVEKLRVHLLKQDVSSSMGGLLISLAAHQSGPAPMVLATHTLAAALSPSVGAAASIAKGAGLTISMLKAQAIFTSILITALLAAGGVAVVMAAHHLLLAEAPTAQLVPQSSLISSSVPTSQPAGHLAAQVGPEIIQPNDRLRVRIFDVFSQADESTFKPRVDSAGLVSLPLIGQVHVSGLEPPEAERAIAKAFRDANLIQNALVLVELAETGSKITMTSGPIQKGDYLRLNVYELTGPGRDAHRETSLISRVDQSGMIDPPHLQSMKVEARTESDVEQALCDAYRAANSNWNPILSVERISENEAMMPPEPPAPQPAPILGSIEPYDRLLITITGLSHFPKISNFNPRVDSSGSIDLRFIRKLKLADISPADAANAIASAIHDRKLNQRGAVTVQITERYVESPPIELGDQLLLGIFDLSSQGMEVKVLRHVDKRGTVVAPLVDAVKVVGLTELEAENAISKAYRTANLIQHADVSVRRASSTEQMIQQ